MKRINKFFSLTSEEQCFFIRAVFLNIYYRISLRRRNIQSVIVEVEKKAKGISPVFSSNLSLNKLSKLITSAAKYVPYSTCLSKALTGKILFAQYGYSSKLHIGVLINSSTGFGAHAWLTFEDEVILCYIPNMNLYQEMPLNELEACR